jgi:beta-1,2-mannobiose phosphorylase / 1,2-beta-oligomannan phosphorylase
MKLKDVRKKSVKSANIPLKPQSVNNFEITGKVIYNQHQLIFYYSNLSSSLHVCVSAGNRPFQCESLLSIWDCPYKIVPVKVKRSKTILHFYFTYRKKLLYYSFSLNNILKNYYSNYFNTTFKEEVIFEKIAHNPIILPSEANKWENNAVFNTAALKLNGSVHFIYRAIGESGHSVFGYASSKDGTQIDKRSPEPAFVCAHPTKNQEKNFNPLVYASGGSWWGCEDPRLTQIDDTIYMTYTAFNGSEPPSVALTSISTANFWARKWNWSVPQRISNPGETNKNWVLFPEKINGKFALLHSLTPEILIDYVDDLGFEDHRFIKSHYYSKGREAHWDNWIRGIGPPPIKTKEGWLILYHAMDKRDPDKYKIGAMILDEKDPKKILYRSDSPLLEPDQWYENNGHKYGVVYSCGATLIGEELLVYYGGSDKYICAARVNVNKLINRLKASAPAKMEIRASYN